MNNHTPTPWTIYDDSDPLHIAIKGYYSDTGGAHVADILSPANAAFILKAANNHELMVAALERIAIACTDNMDRSCDHRMALDFVRQIANGTIDLVNAP
jgi:hypothetical protein